MQILQWCTWKFVGGGFYGGLFFSTPYELCHYWCSLWLVVCVGHSYNDVGGVVEVSNVVFLHSTVYVFFWGNAIENDNANTRCLLVSRNRKSLWDSKHPKHAHTYFRLGGLYGNYEPQYWWFEVAIVVHKMFMTGMLCIIGQGSPMQPLVAILFQLVFLFLSFI